MASKAASIKSPIAEINARTIRPFSCINKLVALFMAERRIKYQTNEVKAQTNPRIDMPRAKLNPSGTNAGINATANIAALTLVLLHPLLRSNS
jgi:hypothetical protein